jgi:hypothetical protein
MRKVVAILTGLLAVCSVAIAGNPEDSIKLLKEQNRIID